MGYTHPVDGCNGVTACLPPAASDPALVAGSRETARRSAQAGPPPADRRRLPANEKEPAKKVQKKWQKRL